MCMLAIQCLRPLGDLCHITLSLCQTNCHKPAGWLDVCINGGDTDDAHEDDDEIIADDAVDDADVDDDGGYSR